MFSKPGVVPYGNHENITEYIKSTDIVNAREAGVDIYRIDVSMGPEAGETLAANIELWLKNEPDLVKHKHSDSKTKKYHGERFTSYTDTYYFSKFKFTRNSSDGKTMRMFFDALSGDELLPYSEPNTLTDNKTPSLLQIAFGLLRKYPSLHINIFKR